MNEKKYIIRNMTQEEVSDIAINWANAEGRNPGLNDSNTFFQSDNTGFFVGLLDNEPISCISAVKYNNDFSFIGFYIVKPSYRGQGYGLKIWQHALQTIQNRNIGLDGVLSEIEKYKTSGFKLAYNNIRYQGISIHHSQYNSNIHKFNENDFNGLIEYDCKLFGTNRKIFLKNWLNQNESYSFVYISNGEIRGYTTIRKCFNGYKFGPLFADDYNIANELFIKANNILPEGSIIFLDIPKPNIQAIKLAQTYNLQEVFFTARMYTNFIPNIDINKIFGVTSFELG